jgi:hypothetical protein
MIHMNKKKIILWIAWISLSCIPITPNAQTISFKNRQDRGILTNRELDEVSGIVASRKNKNVLWVHNDSGDQSIIYALNTQGIYLGRYILRGVVARDWEDIAIGSGPDPQKDYIYIGDFGDNDLKYDFGFIYRIPEPDVSSRQPPKTDFISQVERIMFKFPKKRKNVETLLFDSVTKQMYMVTKSDSISEVYQLPYIPKTEKVQLLKYMGNIPIHLAVGGDISFSGSHLLIKNYLTVYYYKRNLQQTVWQCLQQDPIVLPYVPELQGEAICWDSDERGYFTVSEEKAFIKAHLYYYPGIQSTISNE